MKFEATYYELFVYSKDLNDFALHHPAVAKLLAGGYENFQNRNQMHLNVLTERLKELYEENVLKGDDGQYVMNQGANLEIGERMVFKSKLHEEQFNKDYEELMMRKCDMIIGG